LVGVVPTAGLRARRGVVDLLLPVFLRAAEAAVAIGPDLRVVAWNRAAEDLLGLRAKEARGRPCFEVFRGRDRHGSLVCRASCRVAGLARQGRSACPFELVAHPEVDRSVWLGVSTLVAPPRTRSRWMLVHLFREVTLPPELERLVAERLQDRPAPGPGPAPGPLAEPDLGVLTSREREVLALLIEGAGTREIARRLFISHVTVRNHVQHILHKLGARHRAEVVARALRAGR
jgi:DNA-binding CsgD family transcriptional regulator